MTQTQKWPEKMTKTRQEMTALGLPGGRKKDGATVIENTITDQDRWTTSHELIFRLPYMPDDLAYSTWYREGSTEQQDEAPWEHESAECVLVRKVPKVVETWTAETQPRIEVSRLDPDTLVGIARCDDGSGGWVVMRQDGEGNAEPVGDKHGQIVYVDILDAVEVLDTGIVWKHYMGEGENDIRRPSEESARTAVEEFLEKTLGAVPDFTMIPDGDDSSASGKCGWAFYVREGDTTSYVHEDLTIEWYGTSWKIGDPLEPDTDEP